MWQVQPYVGPQASHRLTLALGWIRQGALYAAFHGILVETAEDEAGPECRADWLSLVYFRS